MGAAWRDTLPARVRVQPRRGQVMCDRIIDSQQGQRKKTLGQSLKGPGIYRTLQEFLDDYGRHCRLSQFQQTFQQSRCRCLTASQQIDPDRGVNQYHDLFPA